MFNYKSNQTLLIKYSMWLNGLPKNTDILDYWYNLFLSETKACIDEDIDNMQAFWYNRWIEDFLEYRDSYKPIVTEEPNKVDGTYLAYYTDYLVSALNIPSREIVSHYGKESFQWIADEYYKLHTFGENLFIELFIEEFGLPPNLIGVRIKTLKGWIYKE